MVFEENKMQSRYALDPGFKARDLNLSAPLKLSDQDPTSGRNGPFSEISEAP